MKKFLSVTLLALSAFLFVSCGGEEKKHCEELKDEYLKEQICPDKKITFCATESGDEMWFVIDGKKYKCEGSPEETGFCDNNIQEIYNDCHEND